jgi:hypothetical protein
MLGCGNQVHGSQFRAHRCRKYALAGRDESRGARHRNAGGFRSSRGQFFGGLAVASTRGRGGRGRHLRIRRRWQQDAAGARGDVAASGEQTVMQVLAMVKPRR